MLQIKWVLFESRYYVALSHVLKKLVLNNLEAPAFQLVTKPYKGFSWEREEKEGECDRKRVYVCVSERERDSMINKIYRECYYSGGKERRVRSKVIKFVPRTFTW